MKYNEDRQHIKIDMDMAIFLKLIFRSCAIQGGHEHSTIDFCVTVMILNAVFLHLCIFLLSVYERNRNAKFILLSRPAMRYNEDCIM